MTGGFLALATLTDITNPLAPVVIDTNLDLHVCMTDRGLPGANDGIAITLKSGSTLLYSSNWVSTLTGEMNLAGGDLLISSTFNVDNGNVSGIGDIYADLSNGAEVIAYPNPSAGDINFKISVTAGTKVTLDVVSMNGGQVNRVFDGFVDAATGRTIRYDSKLPQGIYFYRLTTSIGVRCGKIVINRTY
jgi:hypothetical protein